MTETEKHIILRCKDGDKTAFRWVVQTYQRMVFSLALKMMADEEEAKDVVQETFIHAWLGIGDYDVERPFSTWLYTIGSRLCLNHLKRGKVSSSLPQDEQALQRFASGDDNQQSLENKEWVSIVKVLTNGLSSKQRLVFTLCQLEGLSAAEVEQITGMNVLQVKSNLYVARQRIRKRLKELGYE